jgi:DNA-binding CsgD family transcriptional regulator
LSFFGQNSNRNLPKHQHLIIKYVTPFIALLFEKLSKTSEKVDIHSLTRRELEILKWLKEGKSSWEISMILNIGESTVNFHVTNIMRKLNVMKRTQAVAVAVQNKLIEF